MKDKKSFMNEKSDEVNVSKKQVMKVIGITGGIGSGKSLVADILKDNYDAYIVNTDGIANLQMKPDGASYKSVVDYFGKGILKQDSTIDKKKLSDIVFNDRDKLYKLNSLTHPKVLEEVNREIEEIRIRGDIHYFIIETALMIESGYYNVCDEVWYVYAPENTRRSRLIKARNYSKEKIDDIFDSQMKDKDFRNSFSKVIENDGSIDNIKEQIKALL